MNFIISWKNLVFPFINTVFFMSIGFGILVTNFLVSLSIHSLFCSPFTYYGHAELPFCSHSYDRDQIAEKLEITYLTLQIEMVCLLTVSKGGVLNSFFS